MFSQFYYSQNVVWENVCPTILDTHFHDLLYNFGLWQGFHYCHLYVIWNILIELAQLKLLADVIANIVDDVVPTYVIPWQMLLPYYPLR